MTDESRSTELAVTPDEQALAEQIAAKREVDQSDLVVPALKVTQGQTGEVSEGTAQVGEFVNALTGEDYGRKIEFIVADDYKGWFRVDKDTDEIIVAGPIANSTCGCHGLTYRECPDAEPQYSAAVNRGDKVWGDGPPVSTTYNFIGLVVGTEIPVKLSLKRGQAKDAKKFVTLLTFAKTPWSHVFELETVTRTSKTGEYKYQSVIVKQGRAATAEERQAAVTLAQAIAGGRTVEVDPDAGDDSATPKPDKPAEAEGALDY